MRATGTAGATRAITATTTGTAIRQLPKPNVRIVGEWRWRVPASADVCSSWLSLKPARADLDGDLGRSGRGRGRDRRPAVAGRRGHAPAGETGTCFRMFCLRRREAASKAATRWRRATMGCAKGDASARWRDNVRAPVICFDHARHRLPPNHYASFSRDPCRSRGRRPWDVVSRPTPAGVRRDHVGAGSSGGDV